MNLNCEDKKTENFYCKLYIFGNVNYYLMVLLVIISVFGFIGNSMSLPVLYKQIKHTRNLKNTGRYNRNTHHFDSLLMLLAVYDAILSICLVPIFALPAIFSDVIKAAAQGEPLPYYFKNIDPYIWPYTYGLCHMAKMGSTLATVSVTFERYLTIVWPFKNMDTLKRCLMPFTILFSLAYTLPKFFEVSDVIKKYIENVPYCIL